MQKYHPEGEVRSALETVGFTKIRAYAHDEQHGLGDPTSDSERVFFVCQKPKGEANSS